MAISGTPSIDFLPLIQIADTVGVWGISLLVVFPSSLLGRAFADGLPRCATGQWRRYLCPRRVRRRVPLRRRVRPGLARGHARDGQWKVALVQQDVDPWKGGYTAYRASLDVLERQSPSQWRRNPKS